MSSNSVLRYFPLSRVGVLTVLFLACWLIGIGIRQTWREYQVRDVAEHFTTAVLNADVESARQHLDPLLQDLLQKQLQSQQQRNWPTDSQASFQIKKCWVNRKQARVELHIEKLGFAVKPVLTLQDLPEQGWKITQIDNVRVDDRWLQFTRWEQRQEAEQLAEELTRALEKQPNIGIRRIARDKLPTAAHRVR